MTTDNASEPVSALPNAEHQRVHDRFQELIRMVDEFAKEHDLTVVLGLGGKGPVSAVDFCGAASERHVIIAGMISGVFESLCASTDDIKSRLTLMATLRRGKYIGLMVAPQLLDRDNVHQMAPEVTGE